MAETSGITWTRSTFNPWIGCTKVGPGCDGCYAEHARPTIAFGIKWGAGQPRHRTGIQNWNLPLRWNRLANLERETGKLTVQSEWHTPGFWPVFCSSLADVFDNEVQADWRADLFSLIERTPRLSWLLVTKRIGNVAKMVPAWWMNTGFPDNVRLLITVVNQEEADRDVPKLLALPCKNGISYEPAIGPVDWAPWLEPFCNGGSVPGPMGRGGVMCPRCHGQNLAGCPGLDWIIVGGESTQPGHRARRFFIDWAKSTVAQCRAADVAVFVKQLGSDPYEYVVERDVGGAALSDDDVPLQLKNRAGAEPDEWPAELRVQEFPR